MTASATALGQRLRSAEVAERYQVEDEAQRSLLYAFRCAAPRRLYCRLGAVEHVGICTNSWSSTFLKKDLNLFDVHQSGSERGRTRERETDRERRSEIECMSQGYTEMNRYMYTYFLYTRI